MAPATSLPRSNLPQPPSPRRNLRFPSAIGGNGNTAIDWKKRFTYDDAAHSATIDGDITIVHQGVGPNAQSLRLDHADLVRAEFYSDAADQTRRRRRSDPRRPNFGN